MSSHSGPPLPGPPPHPSEAKIPNPEPRWPALLAILATGLIYSGLPDALSVGPRWLLVGIVVALEIPTMILLRYGNQRLHKIFGYSVSAIMTLFMLSSLALLIFYLPSHKERPVSLLQSASVLWISNVLIFSLWYWRLDAGGPTGRDLRPGHREGAFLFPQMQLPQFENAWSPRFIDYLFLAFNTSTAFSPTDVPVLSRWAKVLVMLQSLISLAILAILASRAVNIM